MPNRTGRGFLGTDQVWRGIGWQTDERTVFFESLTRRDPAIVARVEGEGWDEAADARLRLIVAAPELLATVRHLLDAVNWQRAELRSLRAQGMRIGRATGIAATIGAARALVRRLT